MSHTRTRIATLLAAAGAIAFLAGPAALPASARPICECNANTPAQDSARVQQVEVPVDDTSAELAQMGLAAGLGALLAGGGVLAVRRRVRGAAQLPA